MNRNVLIFCTVAACLSLVGLTLWAADNAANTIGNTVQNAANNMSSNMSDQSGRPRPMMRMREVNTHLDEAIKSLDAANTANDSGDKATVTTKLAECRKHLTEAQQLTKSWRHGGQQDQSSGNMSGNYDDNASNASNMGGNFSNNIGNLNASNNIGNYSGNYSNNVPSNLPSNNLPSNNTP